LLGAEQPKGLAVLEAQGKTGLQTDQQAEFATDLHQTCIKLASNLQLNCKHEL